MDLMNDINGWHMGRHGRVVAYACAVMMLVLQPPTALARVEFTITRVGFPTLRSGDVVRQGEWVPIIVDLALIEQQQEFNGTLRIAQFDSDGDECFDSVDVHLRAETGGTQRLHLYVPANVWRGQLKFAFELLNSEGEAVEVLSEGELTYRPEPAQRPTYIPNAWAASDRGWPTSRDGRLARCGVRRPRACGTLHPSTRGVCDRPRGCHRLSSRRTGT